MQYQILEHHSSAALAKHVGDYLVLGWKPYGNLFVHNNVFYQAIIKEK
ncbi:DUF1737 domain-containing protein [Chryseobacterium sp.]